jgi:hypothetical protein
VMFKPPSATMGSAEATSTWNKDPRPPSSYFMQVEVAVGESSSKRIQRNQKPKAHVFSITIYILAN